MRVNLEKIEQVAERRLPAVFVVFVAITILLIVVHEPWSDEAQAWLLARDASLRDLFFVYAGYEGSPVLWHLILMPFAKLGLPYVTMHIIHAAFTIGMAWIFIRKAPFASLHKILFLFGYFPLFEYNAMSRSYILSAFFLFWMAAAFRSRFERPLLYAVPLALLMQTNVHSFLLGLPFVVLLAHDFFRLQKKPEQRTLRAISVAALAVVALSVVVTIFCLIPPIDLAPQLRTWNLFFLPEKAAWLIGVFVYAFTPVPGFGVHFWDVLNALPLNIPLVVLGFGSLLVLPIIFFGEQHKALLLYVSGVVLFCGIFFLKSPPHMRQVGLLFFFFLTIVWMYWKQVAQSAHTWIRIAQYVALTTILSFQALTVVPAVLADVRGDFSASVPLAQFIASAGYSQDNAVLVGYPAYNLASALPLLAGRFSTVYSIELERPISFTVWNSALYIKTLTPEQLAQRLQNVVEQYPGKKILFVRGGDIPPIRMPDSCTMVANYPQTATDEDTFILYTHGDMQDVFLPR